MDILENHRQKQRFAELIDLATLLPAEMATDAQDTCAWAVREIERLRTELKSVRKQVLKVYKNVCVEEPDRQVGRVSG